MQVIKNSRAFAALTFFSALVLVIASFVYFSDAPDEKVVSYLQKEGYSDIELGRYRLFSCFKGEPNHDSFKAKDNNGREVTGVACSSAGGDNFRIILDEY